MFVKLKTVKNKKYLSIAESYWDKELGKSRQRIVASFGCLDNLNPSQLAAIGNKFIELAGAVSTNVRHDLSKLEEEGRFNWGGKLISHELWQQFDLNDFFTRIQRGKKVKFDLAEVIFKIVLARVLEPSSKLQAFLNQDFYLGTNEVPLQNYYRCLDYLAESKNALEAHLFERNRSLFNLSVDVVFYDVTTLYFESNQADSLRDFGFSKDCKFNEVQVVLGLLVDKDGRPIGFDIYPGNTFEGKTLSTALKKLKSRFDVDQVIIVADRGLNSKINLKSIRDAGFHYIVGSRVKSMNAATKKQVLDIDSYQDAISPNLGDGFKIKSFAHTNLIKMPDGKSISLEEILHCSWSGKRARKDARDRERLVEKAKTLVENPEQLNDKRGAKKYVNKPTSSKPATLNSDKIKSDAQWDGFYGIQCSNPELSIDQVLDAYHSLWRIEEAFRVLKSSLNMRPIYHWTEQRIRGHLTSCFIAFLLERTLELRLRDHDVDYSTDRVRRAIYGMQASLVRCEGAKIYLRPSLKDLSKEILTVLKIKPPKKVTMADEMSL